MSETREEIDLPVRQHVQAIVTASRERGVIVVAPPGSGKTTLVPPGLLDDIHTSHSAVWLVQPRRIAARSVARYIARLRGVPLGGEVGYHVRFDRVAGPLTRLCVVTTGILLRTLVENTTLEGIEAVVLDEFHERSMEMDEALGMIHRLRQTIRPDLRLVVMSATIDPTPLLEHLQPCELIQAEGRQYPVKIRYQQGREQVRLEDQVARVIPSVLEETAGNVLVFLPGVGEIIRCKGTLEGIAQRANVDLFALYGDLPLEQQDAAIDPGGNRRIVLATNIAETSLTIPGVTAVIDSGLARVMQMAPSVGIPRLELKPISKASADQRAGRAGRTEPGICYRLWDERSHHARPAEEPPEILRSDFAEPLLRLIVWGERDPFTFPWLTRPYPESVAKGFALLEWLGALDSEKQLLPLGYELARLPCHPRLGRLLIAGAQRGILREAAIAAALLSERDPFRIVEQGKKGPRDYQGTRSRSDMVQRVLALQLFYAQGTTQVEDLECHPGGARQVLRAADQFYALVESERAPRAADPSLELMKALLDAFPDRLARLRPQSADRALMVGGKGVRIDSRSSVRGEPLFLCLDLQDATGDVQARQVSAVEEGWLSPVRLTERETQFFNPTRGQMEARRQKIWIDLVIQETPMEITDFESATRLLAQAAKTYFSRWLGDDHAAGRFRARVQWLRTAAPELQLPEWNDQELMDLVVRFGTGIRSLEALQQAPWLAWLQESVGFDRVAEIDRLAPEHIRVPSGNRIRLQYSLEKPPILAVRIQELFGLSETPRVAGNRQPVLLHLLGPNHRPQQVTQDLASFWQNTYPQVKKDLRRRYPKHAWPDNPLARDA
jgi:ATP-dependent helicase HrpB